MKKIFMIFTILLGIILLIGCEQNKIDPPITTDPDELTASELAVLNLELRKSFDFFWETTNHTNGSLGYGLARDRYPGNPEIASVAAVGFALASYVVGVEEGFITYEEGFERTDKTMDTLLNLTRVNGFYYHWINMQTGVREWNSEVSIIDTALMLMGGLAAGEYFGGTVKEKIIEIYDGVNWPWYLNPNNQLFYMGYKPETGFAGHWDHMAEQFMVYVLASGSNTYPVSKTPYNIIMSIQNASYKGTYTSTSDPNLSVTTPFYYTYNGSLFQHQFSQGFLDLRDLEDQNGVNWFENAVLATRANYAYVQDNTHLYKTYSELSWGLAASDGPGEYNAYGAKPAKNNVHNGTIAPYAALASINYLPKLVGKTAVHYYTEVSGLFGTYGFKDAYNLGPVNSASFPILAGKTPWVASDYIGIDKGITLIMLANFKNQVIWENVMKNTEVQNGFEVLGFMSKSA